MNKRLITIGLHIVFWALNMFYYISCNDLSYSLSQIAMCIPFYLNYFYLVPRLLQKEGILYQISWVIALWVISIATFAISFKVFIHLLKPCYEFDLFYALCLGFYITFYYASVSTGSRLIVDWDKNKAKNKELASLKTMTEIKLMKSNINIPFMLRVLNHTENLAKASPKSVEEPIILLSNVLRHGLYETQAAFIPLEKEILALEEFISLIRLTESEQNIKLIKKDLPKTFMVLPNVLIRIVGVWKEHHKDLESSNNNILLFGKNNAVSIQLPLSKAQEAIKEGFAKQFPEYIDAHFSMKYSFSDTSLTFKIIKLAP